MGSVSLTGNDSIIINDRTLYDVADGDAVVLTFESNIAELKTGKNGNVIYALNETGRQCSCTIRLIRGSADDKELNKLLADQKKDFAKFLLLYGVFVKRVGDGKEGITNDVYNLSGGVFLKQPDTKTNVEGDTEQSVTIYEIMFGNAPRTLG